MAWTQNSFDLLNLSSPSEVPTTGPSKASENRKSRKARARAKGQNALAGDSSNLSSDTPLPDSLKNDKTATPLKTSVHSTEENTPFDDVDSFDGFITKKTARHRGNNHHNNGKVAGVDQYVKKSEKEDNAVLESVPFGRTLEDPSSQPSVIERLGLESASRALSSDSGRRVQLWYDWITRAQSSYEDQQYSPLTWKQVMVQSQALEITLGACLKPPIGPSDRPHLQNLLATFLSNAEAAQVLSQVVLDLAQGLTAGGNNDKGLLLSMQNALASSVAALKEGETGWAMRAVTQRLADVSVSDKLQKLNAKAGDAEQQLNQLNSNPNELSTLPERARLSQLLVKLSEERFVLLLPDDTSYLSKGSSGKDKEESTAAHALHSIRQLAATIREQRSQVPEAVAEDVSHLSLKEKTEQQASQKKQELQHVAAQLAEEAASIKIQLNTAEKEVERLRGALAAMETRRQIVNAQLEASLQESDADLAGLDAQEVLALPNGSPAERQLAWCARQLGVVHALEALLVRPPESSSGSLQEEVVCTVMCSAVIGHLQALAGHMAHKQQQLHEAGQRLHFNQAKLASMEADLARLLEQGKTKLAKELEKPKDSYHNMTKEWASRVEAIMAEATEVENGLQRPALRTAVALLPPQPPVHLLLNQIGHLLHQMRVEHNTILAGPLPPSPEEVAANGNRAPRQKPQPAPQPVAQVRAPVQETVVPPPAVSSVPPPIRRGWGTQKPRRPLPAEGGEHHGRQTGAINNDSKDTMNVLVGGSSEESFIAT